MKPLLIALGVFLLATECKAAETWEQEDPSHDAAHFIIGATVQYVCVEKLEIHPVACVVGLMAGVAAKEYLVDDNANFLGRDGAGYLAGAGTVTLFKWEF